MFIAVEGSAYAVSLLVIRIIDCHEAVVFVDPTRCGKCQRRENQEEESLIAHEFRWFSLLPL